MTTKPAYSKNQDVVTRVGGHAGVVIDVSREINWDAFHVRFADGTTKWLKSTDLYDAIPLRLE